MLQPPWNSNYKFLSARFETCLVESIDEDGIWVDVYIPADADIPEDTVCYDEDELEVQ